jgi:glutamate synthase domain-containing protein 3
MRRSYDPSYGSRQQLKDCHEHGMIVARERDKLKTENAELKELIEKIVKEISECEDDHCFLHWERINHEVSERS